MRRRISILLFTLLMFGVSVCQAEALTVSELIALSADFLPGPYGGVSYQEGSSPFEPISILPEEFENVVRTSKTPEELHSRFHALGLPLDSYDTEYVYFYRNRKDEQVYPLDANRSLICISYSYSREENDNCVFLFLTENDETRLIDCIFNFGEIQIQMDSAKKNTWLIGKTGSGSRQTVRWYHLGSNRVVLSYLAYGIAADRTDYHFKMESVVVPALNCDFESDGTLTLLKQVSVIDLTSYSKPGDPMPETILYTQSETYQTQENGTLILQNTATFLNQDIQTTISKLTTEN